MLFRLIVGFSLVGCVALVPAAGAQVGQNEISLLGGLVFSTLDGADASGVSRRTALMGAAQLVKPLTTNIGLQTEFGILQKGASLPLGGSSGTGSSALNLTYLQVPAMLRIGFAGKYSEVRPAIFFGPAVALNVGCKYKVGTQGGGEFQANCDPDGPQISAFDFSGLVGGSIEVGRYGAFARYEHGFRTIDASDDRDDLKNRAFVIGVIWNTTSR